LFNGVTAVNFAGKQVNQGLATQEASRDRATGPASEAGLGKSTDQTAGHRVRSTGGVKSEAEEALMMTLLPLQILIV
jgi:hypothetical protein